MTLSLTVLREIHWMLSQLEGPELTPRSLVTMFDVTVAFPEMRSHLVQRLVDLGHIDFPKIKFAKRWLKSRHGDVVPQRELARLVREYAAEKSLPIS